MKKTLFAAFTMLGLSLLLYSCTKDEIQPKEDKPAGIEIPLSGHYVWDFEIPNVGTQESHLVFYKDSVGYVMTGPAYSNNYTMITESYTDENGEKRWIGVGKGGSIPKDDVYFVMFFKDIEDDSAMIYKHECTNGKEEAESFPYPADDATEDHGWNIYIKK